METLVNDPSRANFFIRDKIRSIDVWSGLFCSSFQPSAGRFLVKRAKKWRAIRLPIVKTTLHWFTSTAIFGLLLLFDGQWDLVVAAFHLGRGLQRAEYEDSSKIKIIRVRAEDSLEFSIYCTIGYVFVNESRVYSHTFLLLDTLFCSLELFFLRYKSMWATLNLTLWLRNCRKIVSFDTMFSLNPYNTHLKEQSTFHFCLLTFFIFCRSPKMDLI